SGRKANRRDVVYDARAADRIEVRMRPHTGPRLVCIRQPCDDRPRLAGNAGLDALHPAADRTRRPLVEPPQVGAVEAALALILRAVPIDAGGNVQSDEGHQAVRLTLTLLE